MSLSFRLTFTLTVLLAPVAVFAAPTYEEALAHYKAKDYPAARFAFVQLAEAEPANAKPRYFLGAIAMRRNDHDDAIAQLEQAVALAPDNSDYYAELGGAYGAAARKSGMLSQMSFARKCREALEKAVELNPDNLAARNGLISFYRQAPGFLGGGMPKAYTQAEAIKQRDPMRGLLILGTLYASERRFDEAFASAEEFLRLQPDGYLAHYTLGRLAAESGQRLDIGEKHLRRCLELSPAADEPGHAAVHWRLGVIAEKRGDATAARTAYETALGLDPAFKQASDALAKLK
jgi:tetratricopeptide (TPR) repeat protein